MISLFVVLCVTLVTYSEASLKSQTSLKSHAYTKLELFLAGFGEGIESDFAKNATQFKACIKDEALMIQYLENGFHDIKEGVDRLSLSQIERGVNDIGRAFQEVAAALKVCNFEELGTAIEHIAKDLEEGYSGWVKLLLKELLEVWKHRKGMAHDLHEASKAWKEGQWFTSGVYSGKFFGVFIEGGL